MFRTKKQPTEATSTPAARRPRSRSFSENMDYLGLDDDVVRSPAGATRRAPPAAPSRSRSRGRGSSTATTTSRRGRSLSRGRSSQQQQHKGPSFLDTLRRARSRSRPRNTDGSKESSYSSTIDPNERWQTIVKTTGILSSGVNVRSENGFVGSRAPSGRIVQGSRVPVPAVPAASANQGTSRRRSYSRQDEHHRDGGSSLPRDEIPKRRNASARARPGTAAAATTCIAPQKQQGRTEHIRPSRSSIARQPAPRPSMPPSKQRQQQQSPVSRKRLQQVRSRSLDDFDGFDADERLFEFDDQLASTASGKQLLDSVASVSCHSHAGGDDGDHHTAATASIRSAASSQDRSASRKSSLGHTSRRSAGSRSSGGGGRPRIPPPQDQQPDASQSAPSKLMSTGATSFRSRDSRTSSRRTSALREGGRGRCQQPRAAAGPSPAVDSIRLRSKQQATNRLKHSQQSMDGFRPPVAGDPPPAASTKSRKELVNSITPTVAKAANGDEGHLEALKDHEGPSGGTVARPTTRAASRSRSRSRREYYQDNENDDLFKRSHRSLDRSRSRSVGRRARKAQRQMEREDRAERMMRRRASSLSRHSSRRENDIDDDSDEEDEERVNTYSTSSQKRRNHAVAVAYEKFASGGILDSSGRLDDDEESKKEIEPCELPSGEGENVVDSGSTLAASNYAGDFPSRSTTKDNHHLRNSSVEKNLWAQAYLSLPGDESDDDEREWQVDNADGIPTSAVASVDVSAATRDTKHYNETTELGDDDDNDVTDLQERLMRLAADRKRNAKSNKGGKHTRRGQFLAEKNNQEADRVNFENSFASAVAIDDIDDDGYSDGNSATEIHKNDNLHSSSSASTTEGALDGSLHFDGERFDHTGNEKYHSSHRCVLEDPFGLLDPDESEQFQTADGWMTRKYDGGKAA